MNSRLLSVIIIFPIWLTLMLVFRRHRHWLLYYLVAAFGFAIQVIFLAEYFGLDQLLVNLASFHVSLIAKGIFKFNVELLSNGRFQLLPPGSGSSILKLGIECSAVLESTILIALVGFYPLFNIGQKILRISFGLVITYVINIIRLLIIVFMAYKLGPDYIFVAHAFVARTFFFIAELILYWYLITKPTVKSVGDAIKNGVPIEKTAFIGRSLKLKHALGQITAIFLVLLLTLMSFGLSKDWKKSFGKGIKQSARPIIYQDETDIEKQSSQNQGGESHISPGGELQSSINQDFVLKLGANKKESIILNARKAEVLYVQVPEGKQNIAARLMLNGQPLDFIEMTPQQYTKQLSVFDSIRVNPGDTLEIKFQNSSEKSSKYLVKIFPKDGRYNQLCQAGDLIAQNQKPTPVPTPSPSIQVTPTPLVAVKGTNTASFNQETALTLAGGEKTTLGYQIDKTAELSIQVLEGRGDLAARLYLNGQEVEFITSAPWRFLKQKSIFSPVIVKPGDYLEIKFQNLDEKASDYLINVYSKGEVDGQ